MYSVHLDGALAHAVAPHLDGPVVRAGDDAAVGRRRHAKHRIVPGQRDDLAGERPHVERARAASQSALHVGAMRAMS